MANRIAAYTEVLKERYAARAAAGNPITNDFNITFDEFVEFNNLQAQAHAAGVITFDEAQTIYGALGEAGPDKFNAQPIHVKMALAKILTELAKWKAAQIRAGC